MSMNAIKMFAEAEDSPGRNPSFRLAVAQPERKS
jgi:hypothetical protein